MKRQKLSDALNEISDIHITEAAAVKKKKKLPWLGAIAAVLALVLVLRFADIPMAIQANAVSLASESRVPERPDHDDYQDTDQWRRDLDAWVAQRDARSSTAAEALDTMNSFLMESCREFLSGSQENLLYSPINAYIGLAMAAELTGGQTRQQLLDALGAADTQTLRKNISALWETVYQDDGNEICALASSLWLDEDLEYNQAVMDTLAYDYYASVYQQELNSAQAQKDIQAWLNNNTGGFLRESVQGVQLPQQAVLSLYSTIYFQAKWSDEFQASDNTRDTFHGLTGDISATFMNAKLRQMNYYWGESFGAVSLGLKNGSQMWLILPDEGKTTDDVLAQGEYLDMITASYDERQNVKYMKVNLSVPKFDIQTQANLRSGLENMGITDLFNFKTADFSPSFDGPACFTAANQAVRVEIDEQGVKAAAYIEFPAAGAAMPPEEIIDFVLDRPFLFVIAGSNGIPLFAGTVNRL